MLNFHAEADSVIEARLDCDVTVRLDGGKYISDVVIEPRVTDVDLRLVDLDLQRVSKLGGDAAHELGSGLKGLIAKQLNEREPKIKDKINASIAKRQDAMRISPEKMLAASWNKALSTFGYGACADASATAANQQQKQKSAIAPTKPLASASTAPLKSMPVTSAPAPTATAASSPSPLNSTANAAPVATPSTPNSAARPWVVLTEEPRLPLTPVILNPPRGRTTVLPPAIARPASFEEQPPLVPVHK